MKTIKVIINGTQKASLPLNEVPSGQDVKEILIAQGYDVVKNLEPTVTENGDVVTYSFATKNGSNG